MLVKDTNVLVAVFSGSKANQSGKPESAQTYRHRKVEICPFGALAFYFFYRFEIANDPWPKLVKTKNERLWYRVKVFKDLSYLTQHAHLKGLMKVCFLCATYHLQFIYDSFNS